MVCNITHLYHSNLHSLPIIGKNSNNAKNKFRMKDIILQSPVEVENESDVCVTLQLPKTMIEDADGEREVCPDVVLICQRRKNSGKCSIMSFNVHQVEKLIRQLTALKDAAIEYNKARLEQ